MYHCTDLLQFILPKLQQNQVEAGRDNPTRKQQQVFDCAQGILDVFKEGREDQDKQRRAEAERKREQARLRQQQEDT